MANVKYAVTTNGLATVTKAPAGPKTEPHLMSVEEIASRVKAYVKPATKNVPVPTLTLGIGGCIVPFAFFSDNGTATNRTAEFPAGYEDSEENRADLAAAYADAYLASPEIQAQVKDFLVARHFRLLDEKKAKEAKAVATKVAKVNLAVKAETHAAAEVFGEIALED